MAKVKLKDSLFDRIKSAVRPGETILPLADKQQNAITAIGRDGFWVETLRSDSRQVGPQLVPAWMIVTAWRPLIAGWALSNSELLSDFDVKRSSFVIGLLAEFPDGVVRSTQPIMIELFGRSTEYLKDRLMRNRLPLSDPGGIFPDMANSTSSRDRLG